MLELKGLSYAYPQDKQTVGFSSLLRLGQKKPSHVYPQAKHPAINQLNWSIETGLNYVVFGGFGSGKTTLLRALGDLLGPEVQKQLIWLERYADLPPQLRRAYAPRHFDFPPQHSPLAWWQTWGQLHGWTSKQIKDRAFELAETLGLKNRSLEQKTPAQEQAFNPQANFETRLLSLIQAQLFSPALLLVDDPLWGLDYPMANQYWTGLQKIRKPEQTLVYTARRNADLAPFTDQILWLVHGHRRALVSRQNWPEQEADLQKFQPENLDHA